MKLRAIISGFRRKRLVTTVYIIQLLFAITIGLQVYNVIDASIGNSYAIEGIKSGSAHMVINDLLNVHGPSLSPLLGQLRWIILVYLIISAFINAGIWYSILGPGNKNSFWIGGANYFARCLKVGLFWTALFAIISIVLWTYFFANLTNWMEQWISEKPIVLIGVAIILIWSVLSVFLFVGTSYSKIYLIKQNAKSWRSIIYGIRTALKKTISLFPMLLIFAVILLLLYSFHMVIDDLNFINTSLGIFVLFFIQQLIVWSKIAIRISAYEYLADVE